MPRTIRTILRSRKTPNGGSTTATAATVSSFTTEEDTSSNHHHHHDNDNDDDNNDSSKYCDYVMNDHHNDPNIDDTSSNNNNSFRGEYGIDNNNNEEYNKRISSSSTFVPTTTTTPTHSQTATSSSVGGGTGSGITDLIRNTISSSISASTSMTNLTKNRANSSSSSSLKISSQLQAMGKKDSYDNQNNYGNSSNINNNNNNNNNNSNSNSMSHSNSSVSYHPIHHPSNHQRLQQSNNTRLRTSIPHLQQQQQLQINKKKIPTSSKSTISTPSRSILSILYKNNAATSATTGTTTSNSTTSVSTPGSTPVSSTNTNTNVSSGSSSHNVHGIKNNLLISTSPSLTTNNHHQQGTKPMSLLLSSPFTKPLSSPLSSSSSSTSSSIASFLSSPFMIKLLPILPKILRFVLLLLLFNFSWLVMYTPTPNPKNTSTTTTTTTTTKALSNYNNKYNDNDQQQQEQQNQYLRNEQQNRQIIRSNDGIEQDTSVSSLNHFDHHHHPLVPLVLNGNADIPIHFELLSSSSSSNNNITNRNNIRLAIDETISKFDTVHDRWTQKFNDFDENNNDNNNNKNKNNYGDGSSGGVSGGGSDSDAVLIASDVAAGNRLITTTTVPIIENPSIAALQKLHEQEQRMQQQQQQQQQLQQPEYETSDERQQPKRQRYINDSNHRSSSKLSSSSTDLGLFSVTKNKINTVNKYYNTKDENPNSNNNNNIHDEIDNGHYNDKKLNAVDSYYYGNQIDTVHRRHNNGGDVVLVDEDEDSSAELVIPLPEVNKGTSHKLDDGDDNVLLVLISDRVDGIIPTIGSILQHCSLTTKVDVVLVGEHEVNERVHYHFGNRIHQFISLTVDDVQEDLQRNGIDPIWTWPEWHSSINDKHWKNDNTIRVADWDNLPTHAHELNHLRFYLPYVSIFRNKGYFYFLDDDVLVHKDLGPVAKAVMKDIPPTKGLITPCNIWLWDSQCHHFTFHDQNDTILNMPSLYGDRQVCTNSAEDHCFPPSYIDFIQSVLPPNGVQQKAWNFGFSLFALDNWRDLKLTDRYEKVMKRSYELHVFPETSLTFGLGGSYLAFAGAVECWDEKYMVVRDGFGFIEWNRYETTFGGSDFYNSIDVAHYTGPEKPWIANVTIDVQSLQPWLDVMAKERLHIPDQLPTRPSRNLFALVASDRTGAQWIMNTLDSHPQVCASGETEKPETGFSSDVLLPTGLPWYPTCSIKRGCTYAYIEQAVQELVQDMVDTDTMKPIPRRCMKGYDPRVQNDPRAKHLDRLCTFVDRLGNNYTQGAIGRLWIEAFVTEDKSLVGCSCARGTYAKGIKIEPEWLTYENFPDEVTGPPQLVLDDSLIHGSKIIRLKRKNVWARYKSMLMAKKSGQYHLQTPEAKQVQEQSIEMMTVSIEEMEWSINHMITIDKFGDEWASKHASEVLWIEYESCRDNSRVCFQQIFEFLEVDPSYVDSNSVKFQSNFADLHLDESLDHIKNSDVVSESLAVNGWGNCIGLDNYTEIQLFIYDEKETLAKTRQIKGINTTMYGHDPEAEGYGCRFTAAVPLLRSLPPTTLVVLSDDRDLLINYPSGSDSFRYFAISEFRKAFKELSRKKKGGNGVIVSAEADCCASALTHVSPGDYFDAYGRRVGRACSSGMVDCPWAGNEKALVWQNFMKKLAIKRCGVAADTMFLDAGLIVGYASDLLDLVSDLQIQSSEDDRAVLTDFMYRFPERILLDYGMRLFGLSHGNPRSSLHEHCMVREDRPALASRYLNPLYSDTTALFVHSPRDVGCHPFENSRIQRFPSWGKEGILLRPTLEHFNRVLSGSETIVLPPSYGRKLDALQGGPEIPYVIDSNGLFASDVVRNRTDDGSYQLRIRPTEALFKLAYRILKRVRAPDERFRWRKLLKYVDSGAGFPYWTWYGDYRSCNKNNFNSDSIPVFTTAARMDCDYAFPIPNYMSIIDTQRSSVHWHGVFRQFEKKYPWDNKIQKLVWRGSLSEAEWKDTYTNIRWRLCKTVHDLRSNLYDVGLTSIPKHISDKVFVNMVEVGGFAKEITPMREFMEYRAILDMDGASWSSRFGSLLCFNSVVIKVEPTYAEYFFTGLVPWTHYVPVKSDLSDLHENVQWTLDPENEIIVKSIIASANQFCAERLTPANLAYDLLDIWESYVHMLDIADSSWSKKWKILKKELFASNSIAKMVPI